METQNENSKALDLAFSIASDIAMLQPYTSLEKMNELPPLKFEFQDVEPLRPDSTSPQQLLEAEATKKENPKSPPKRPAQSGGFYDTDDEFESEFESELSVDSFE